MYVVFLALFIFYILCDIVLFVLLLYSKQHTFLQSSHIYLGLVYFSTHINFSPKDLFCQFELTFNLVFNYIFLSVAIVWLYILWYDSEFIFKPTFTFISTSLTYCLILKDKIFVTHYSLQLYKYNSKWDKVLYYWLLFIFFNDFLLPRTLKVPEKRSVSS